MRSGKKRREDVAAAKERLRFFQTFRALAFLAVIALVILAVAAVVVWQFEKGKLTVQLERTDDVYLFFKSSIESDRRAIESRKAALQRRPVDWPEPQLAKVPKTFVDLYLMSAGCPRFLSGRRVEGLAWNRLLFKAYKGDPWSASDGDGPCEVIILARLASRFQPESPLQRLVLVDLLHRLLTRAQMVAYDLESFQDAAGVVGLEANAQRLIQKPFDERLTLADLAELQLALPPYFLWRELNRCDPPVRLRGLRDNVLDRMAATKLAPREDVEVAQAQPLQCTLVKR